MTFAPEQQDAHLHAGLTESEARRFQALLLEDCHADLSLPEAWGRATELLSLVEGLARDSGALERFALPPP